MSTVADTTAAALDPVASDPFFYGWRMVERQLPDGSTRWVRIPLTPEDYLHPQEGDVLVEGSLHYFLCAFLATVFESRVSDNPAALVLSSTIIIWDIPGLGNHGPDVAVIFGIRQRRNEWHSFRVAEEGTRPRVIVELVTPAYRNTDVVDKFREYHRARVPIYVILDREREEGPWVIRAYQRTPRRYQPLPLEEDGRLWLDDLNLWLAVDGLRVRCFDGDTDKELGDYKTLTHQIAEVTARAEAEKTRADAEQARAAAEQTRADAEKARADAAEAQTRALQEEIARLRGQSNP